MKKPLLLIGVILSILLLVIMNKTLYFSIEEMNEDLKKFDPSEAKRCMDLKYEGENKKSYDCFLKTLSKADPIDEVGNYKYWGKGGKRKK